MKNLKSENLQQLGLAVAPVRTAGPVGLAEKGFFKVELENHLELPRGHTRRGSTTCRLGG
jgi:hypothetical protein